MLTVNFQEISTTLDLRYIEFRAKEFEEIRTWDELIKTGMKPVLFVQVIDEASAETIAKKILGLYPSVKEVRWNFAGSLQGHYVTATFSQQARWRKTRK